MEILYLKNVLYYLHYEYFVTIRVKSLHSTSKPNTQAFISLSNQKTWIDWISLNRQSMTQNSKFMSFHLSHLSPASSSANPLLKSWAGRVAQAVSLPAYQAWGPEFKPQYSKKKKIWKYFINLIVLCVHKVLALPFCKSSKFLLPKF
jgi:hypothetical protein